MPQTTTKYPEILQVPVKEGTMADLKERAARSGESVAETVRRMLTHQLSEEAAVDGIGAVEAALRRVIQKELAPTREFAFQGAFNAKVAVSMIWSLWVADQNTWPLPEEKAQKVLGQFRQRATEQQQTRQLIRGRCH